MQHTAGCQRLSGWIPVVVAGACLLAHGCSPTPPPPGAAAATETSDAPPDTSHESPRVLVVGAGISGLTAALELGRAGIEVTVIDMASVFGGHAVMSQGSVSIVATPAQEQAGIHDSPELAFQDFHRWGEDPATDWVRLTQTSSPLAT